jgi:hypothetical protein
VLCPFLSPFGCFPLAHPFFGRWLMVSLRPTAMALLTAVLALFLVACQKPEVEVAANPMAELCDDLVGQVESFNEGVDRAGQGQPLESTQQTRFAAANIDSMIEIAKRQGLDTATPATEWVDSVQLAAQVFVQVSDSGFDGVSDEDAIAVLERIDQWFAYAVDQCEGQGT